MHLLEADPPNGGLAGDRLALAQDGRDARALHTREIHSWAVVPEGVAQQDEGRCARCGAREMKKHRRSVRTYDTRERSHERWIGSEVNRTTWPASGLKWAGEAISGAHLLRAELATDRFSQSRRYGFGGTGVLIILKKSGHVSTARTAAVCVRISARSQGGARSVQLVQLAQAAATQDDGISGSSGGIG